MIDYTAVFAIVVTVFAASMLAFFCAALAYYGIKRILGDSDEKGFLCYPQNRDRFISFAKRISAEGDDGFVSRLDKLSLEDRSKFNVGMDNIRRKIRDKNIGVDDDT